LQSTRTPLMVQENRYRKRQSWEGMIRAPAEADGSLRIAVWTRVNKILTVYTSGYRNFQYIWVIMKQQFPIHSAVNLRMVLKRHRMVRDCFIM
jgi:hypothetical protein